MRLGFVPLALQFAISVGSWMVKSRINAATAAQYAAAEFEYFKSVSDAELTSISFEMAKQFSQYPYWEWFAILHDLREYGVLQPGAAPPPPPGATMPTIQPLIPSSAASSLTNTWLLVAVGVFVIFALTEG